MGIGKWGSGVMGERLGVVECWSNGVMELWSKKMEYWSIGVLVG